MVPGLDVRRVIESQPGKGLEVVNAGNECERGIQIQVNRVVPRLGNRLRQDPRILVGNALNVQIQQHVEGIRAGIELDKQSRGDGQGRLVENRIEREQIALTIRPDDQHRPVGFHRVCRCHIANGTPRCGLGRKRGNGEAERGHLRTPLRRHITLVPVPATGQQQPGQKQAEHQQERFFSCVVDHGVLLVSI